MNFDLLFALIVFAFVTSITPGPNNFMLLASGVNFGFRRTVPHMLGIAVGFFALLCAVGLGLGAALAAYPELHLALKILGGAYLLFLAWKIAMSRSLSGKGEGRERPMSFMAAAAFQWVNPKAWILALMAMAVYTDPQRPVLSVLFVTAAFLLVMAPAISTWVGFGTALRGFLADPARLKWFNIGMGILLALTLVPMLR